MVACSDKNCSVTQSHVLFFVFFLFLCKQHYTLKVGRFEYMYKVKGQRLLKISSDLVLPCIRKMLYPTLSDQTSSNKILYDIIGPCIIGFNGSRSEDIGSNLVPSLALGEHRGSVLSKFIMRLECT